MTELNKMMDGILKRQETERKRKLWWSTEFMFRHSRSTWFNGIILGCFASFCLGSVIALLSMGL